MISCDNLGPSSSVTRNDHQVYSSPTGVANDTKLPTTIKASWTSSSQEITSPCAKQVELSNKSPLNVSAQAHNVSKTSVDSKTPAEESSPHNASLDDHTLATAMSTTQESINIEELNTISSRASRSQQELAKDNQDGNVNSSKHASSLTKQDSIKSSEKTTAMPEMWQKMSCQIRSAVAKSMLSTDVVKRAPSLAKVEKDALGVETAPTEYMIEITDELREFTEVKMNQGQLTHNKKIISMDVLLNQVMEYNRLNPSTPLNIAPALQRSFIVGKTQQYPELVTENLRPVERLRLSSMERTYQKMLARSTPVFKKLQKADSHHDEVPETLMIELKSSVAMALSLLLGLFGSFAIGWFGGPYLGLRSTVSRAILGLVLTVLCMFTEMALVILRSAKLDRIRSFRSKRQQRHLEQARIKLHKSPTPSTEATNYSVPSIATANEELIKEE